MDYSTLYSHKYICELYMDKAGNINWRKLPIAYLNKEYCYYAVPGKSTLEYKRTFNIFETFKGDFTFENWFDRVSYMHDTIKHGGRYYFWDSFIESDEGKEFKKTMKGYHENEYPIEEKRKIGYQINKLINDKHKLLAQIEKLDKNIEELHYELDKI